MLFATQHRDVVFVILFPLPVFGFVGEARDRGQENILRSWESLRGQAVQAHVEGTRAMGWRYEATVAAKLFSDSSMTTIFSSQPSASCVLCDMLPDLFFFSLLALHYFLV